MIKPSTPLPWSNIAKWSEKEAMIRSRNEGGEMSHVMGPGLNDDVIYARHAANCHGDLVEAIERVLRAADPEDLGTYDGVNQCAGIRPSNGELVFKGAFLRDLEQLRAALTKAKS